MRTEAGGNGEHIQAMEFTATKPAHFSSKGEPRHTERMACTGARAPSCLRLEHPGL